MKKMLNLTNCQKSSLKEIKKHIDSIMKDGDIFNEDSFLLLKGSAGCGKTYLTRLIVIYCLNEYNLKVKVLAPTHKALEVIKKSIRLDEDDDLSYSTIHSFLKLKPVVDSKTGKQHFVNLKKNSLEKKDEYDVIIVDESSMVGNELYSKLTDEILTNNVKFVLFVGDEYQLPVVEEVGEGDKHPIFESKNIEKFSLEEIVRNTDNEVIDFATNIRNMIRDKKSKKDLFNFLNSEKNNPSHKKIKFFDSKKELVKDYILKDNRFGELVDDVIISYSNKTVNFLNQNIRDYYTNLNLKQTPEICLQDKFIVQETNLNFQNSEIIKLQSFQEVSKVFNYPNISQFNLEYYQCKTTDYKNFNLLKKDKNNTRIYNYFLNELYNHAKKTKSWKNYYAFKEFFLDVKYLYACTAHKSQGSTYDNVWLDFSEIPSNIDDDMLLRLFYVGVTRARNEVNILISN